MSYHNTRSGRPSRGSSLSDQGFSFGIGSSYLMLSVDTVSGHVSRMAG